MTPNRDFSFYSFVFSNTLCIPNFFRISMDYEASCLVLTFNKHVACEDTRDCIANHSAFRTPNLLKREKEKEKKGGDQAGRTKHFLRRINALCGVNYQLRQGLCRWGSRCEIKSVVCCLQGAAWRLQDITKRWVAYKQTTEWHAEYEAWTNREWGRNTKRSELPKVAAAWVSESEGEDMSKWVCAHSRENEKVNEVIRANGGK